jgi:glycine/D-amino acid oxidase-like deaminating enzyme
LEHDPDQVIQHFGTDLGGRMVALSDNAPNFVFQLIERHQMECQALQSGTLRATARVHDALGVRATEAQWARRGAPVRVLERDEIERTTGAAHYECALLDQRGGQVNPLGYARRLAKAAMQAGAAVHGSTLAPRVQRSGARWRVETPTGTVRAEKLVLATNGYSDDLWSGLRRSIVPAYSAIVASEPLPERWARSIMPARSVLYEMGRVTVYYRVDRDNRLLMGGRSMQPDVSAPDELGHLIDYAIRLWPTLRAVKWTHA